MKEKTMEQVLKENKERILKSNKEKKEKLKKEEIKEWILFIFIATFILIISSILLVNLNKEDLNNCMSKGYSETTCLKNI